MVKFGCRHIKELKAVLCQNNADSVVPVPTRCVGTRVPDHKQLLLIPASPPPVTANDINRQW